MSDSLIYDKTIYSGRPLSCCGRADNEIAAYDFLDSLGVEYFRLDHGAVFSSEDGEAVEEQLGIKICKNLFLCNASKSEFYLLLMPWRKRYVTKVFSKLIGSSRLSFAPEEYMKELLGVMPGSVSILGLVNDKACRVHLYIDADVMKNEYFGCHPCQNTSSLKIKTEELCEKILPKLGHEYSIVELPW